MKRLFCALTFILILCSCAFALSDAEYLKMKRTDKEFAQADRELARVWDEIKDVLTGREFEILKREQLQWIKKGRDSYAQKLIRQGYSRPEAYTAATYERINSLKESYLDY